MTDRRFYCLSPIPQLFDATEIPPADPEFSTWRASFGTLLNGFDELAPNEGWYLSRDVSNRELKAQFTQVLQ